VQPARNYLLRGPSYTTLKFQLAVIQNFATFDWLLWQQGSLGVNLNETVRLPDLENRGYVNTARNYLLRGPSYTALKSP